MTSALLDRMPKAKPAKPMGEASAISEYVEACKAVDALTPAVRMLQLRHFLAERKMKEYDAEEVHKYLCDLACKRQEEVGANRINIEWMPLRKVDRKTNIDWVQLGEAVRSSSVYCIQSRDIYPKVVPRSVITTVATISKEFPDARFFVSDIKNVQDPFLGVGFPGQVLAIIEVWSEPGFMPTK